MKEILTPEQWAQHLNKYVKHKFFGEVLLVGLQIQCEENNNLMLKIKERSGDYCWVYNYETEPIIYSSPIKDPECTHPDWAMKYIGGAEMCNKCGKTWG